MTQAAVGDTVRFHFTGELEDGSQFESSVGQDPIEVKIGSNEFLAGVEHALVGMAPGDTKTVVVPAADAFGPHRPELIDKVERVRFPPDFELAIGKTLSATDSDGEKIEVVVLELSDTTVMLDANHPLAGKDLTFELQLIEII